MAEPKDPTEQRPPPQPPSTPSVELSLIIPAYNEQDRLGPTLDHYVAALQQRFGDAFEVIVVVNGSRDGTAEVAAAASASCPRIRVVNLPAAVGKGGAIIEGFSEARGARILFTDADGSTSATSLLPLADELDEHDVVIGSRHLPNSVVTRPQPLPRRLFSRAFNAAVRRLFDLPFRDTQCGAKAFRDDAAYQLVGLVEAYHWTFDLDLLLTARALGLDIVERPVVWADKPGSRLRVLTTMREVGGAVWGLRGFRQEPAWFWQDPAWLLAIRALRCKARCKVPMAVPNVMEAVGSLRILALNWRCAGHAQAGGAELNLFEHAERWAAYGHHVTVVCSEPHARSTGMQCGEGITLQRVGGRFTVYPLAAPRLLRLQRVGGRFTVYPLVALHLLRHGRKYDRILDVANGIPFFAPLFTRTPVTLLVHHVHDRQWFAEFPYPIALLGRFLESRVMPLVYRNRPIIAVSPTTKEALLELGVSPLRVRVIYNGIEFPAEPPVGLRAHHRVAYVGRLKRYKRVGRLVAAVGDLRHEFPDIRLDIVGDGDARPAIEDLIDRLQLRDHVSVHGFVDEETKARLLSEATVFATASMHEGWGLSVIEANAYGCPAVAFDVPGLRLAIRHGETGLLARDDDGFREAIACLLRDPGRREDYAAAARSWAASFDWQAAARETLWVLAADDALLVVAPQGIAQLAAQNG